MKIASVEPRPRVHRPPSPLPVRVLLECGAAAGLRHPGFDLQIDISGNNKAARVTMFVSVDLVIAEFGNCSPVFQLFANIQLGPDLLRALACLRSLALSLADPWKRLSVSSRS